MPGEPEVKYCFCSLKFNLRNSRCNSRHAITQIEINMIIKVLIKKFKLYNPATDVFLIKGKYFPLFSLALSLLRERVTN